RGAYRFAHMRSGSAFVVVHALGWEEVRRRFDITGPLDIDVIPGTAYEGRVLDGVTRAPIEGAKLTSKWSGASWLPRMRFLAAPPLPEVTLTTDRSGRFAFDRIGLQTGAVQVVAPGYQDYLSHDFEPEILLFGALALRGVVVDPGDRPVAGARVHLLRSMPDSAGGLDTPTASVISDADGRFEFARVDPYGRLEIIAQHPDWAPARTGALTVPLPEPLLRLQLVRPGRISGEVRSATRLPVPGAVVTLASLDQQMPRTLRGSMGRT